MDTLSLITVFSLLAPFAIGAPVAEAPYFALDNQEATVYYDLSGADTCFGPNWSSVTGMTGPVASKPACEWVGNRTLSQINMATPIAFNDLLTKNDLLNWCGRIFKPNGEEYLMDTGPFFIWDGCENCNKGLKIDLSTQAHQGLSDLTTSGNPCDNPSGLRVEVTNDYYWKLGYGGEVNMDPTEADRGSGTFEGPIPTAVTTSGVGPSDPANPPKTAPLPSSGTWTGAVAAATTAAAAGGVGVGVSSGYPGANGVPTVSATAVIPGSSSIIPNPATAQSVPTVPIQHSVPVQPSIPSGSQNSVTSLSSLPISSVPSAVSSINPANPTSVSVPSGPPTGSASVPSVISSVSAPVHSNPVSAPSNAASNLLATSAGAPAAGGSALPVGSPAGQEGAFVPNGAEASCQIGTYECHTNELRVCDNIGNNKIGWRPSTQCPNKCEVSSNTITCN